MGKEKGGSKGKIQRQEGGSLFYRSATKKKGVRRESLVYTELGRTEGNEMKREPNLETPTMTGEGRPTKKNNGDKES